MACIRGERKKKKRDSGKMDSLVMNNGTARSGSRGRRWHSQMMKEKKSRERERKKERKKKGFLNSSCGQKKKKNRVEGEHSRRRTTMMVTPFPIRYILKIVERNKNTLLKVKRKS